MPCQAIERRRGRSPPAASPSACDQSRNVNTTTFIEKKIAIPNRVIIQRAWASAPPAAVMAEANRQPEQQNLGSSVSCRGKPFLVVFPSIAASSAEGLLAWAAPPAIGRPQ